MCVYTGLLRANSHSPACRLLRLTCTPVHYEQTVRPRAHRYTRSKQSGPGHTGTLGANSQAPGTPVH